MTDPPTIFTEMTPPGRGGISVLAVLGPEAAEVVQGTFRAKGGGPLMPGRLHYGHVLDARGETIDECIVRIAHRDAGRAEVEIHCHGGPVPVRAVAERLADLGAGEVPWTEYVAARSHSRVELDAERLLPQVASLRAAMLVIRQRNGLLRDAVRAVIASAQRGDVAGARQRVERLLEAYRAAGRHIERPPSVAILGPPNAGKSSLLNCLAGRERSIVTPTPGTTRDVVTETVILGGLPVVVADTAGLRDDTADVVEQLGIERARAEAIEADVLVYLVDLVAEPGGHVERWLKARPENAIAVGAKADLLRNASPDAGRHAGQPWHSACDVVTSSVTGRGVDELSGRILTALGFRWPAPEEAVPFAAGQAGALERCRAALDGGQPDAAADAALDMLRP